MNPPQISVVIATYNRPQYLKECLDAIAKQTLKDFEVIVVDDGSDTDYAEKLVMSLVESNALSIRGVSQKNRGAATARNRGVSMARGEIIAFTDDDCIPDKEWLEKGVRHFSDPEVVAVEGLINKELKETTPTSCVTYTFKKGGYMTANMFYRKSAFEAVDGFDTNFKSFREDTDLGWRVEEKGRIVHEPESIVIHRIIDYSVWNFFKKHIKLKETFYDVLLYKKHPEKFKKSGELVMGLSSHMFWPYVMLGPVLLFLFSSYWFPSASRYFREDGLVDDLIVAITYPLVVFFHTRMRSSIGVGHIAKHPIKCVGLLCVWWIAIVWDIYQRIKAMIVFRKVLL